MAKTRVTVTLPAELVEEARRESRNLSRTVADALTGYLLQRRADRARSAFGAWSRPDEFDSVAFVNALRAGPDGGRFAR